MNNFPIHLLMIDGDENDLDFLRALLAKTPGLDFKLQRAPNYETELEARVAERTAELTRANASLVETDRRKDEFLAVLAHELRNPLAALAAAVELLSLNDSDPSNRERLTGVLQRQIRQLSHLVDDLLDVARIMRGKIQLHKEAVSLKDILAQAIETTRSLLNARRHNLHVSLPDIPFTVVGDATRLMQVFANLLNNAAKFTNDGGDIWIVAELSKTPNQGQPSHEVRVRIRDNGIGMSADVLPHIFDLFVQASSSRERAGAGLGVGLTLVKRLVHLHGGSISAHSEGPGRGSEFVVSLPLHAPVPAAINASSDRPLVQPIPKRRVLLVDDNIDTADTLAKLLRHLGQDVAVAHDGAGALQTAPDFRPEIILLDIGLPGLNGYEVATRLRQQAGMEKTLLIALTGYSQEEDRIRSMNAGFDHYLIKPIRLKTLENLLLNPKTFIEASPSQY